MLQSISVRRGAVVTALAVAALLLGAAPASAQWGTIKGQVVWGEATVPAPVELKVDKDTAHCLAKGKIFAQDLLINEKTKGVANVIVYLASADNATDLKFAPKVHPSLAKMKPEVVIDQPNCMFTPRVIALREGQKLVVKNTATIPHNFAITSAGGGPTINQLIPANGSLTVGDKTKFVPGRVPTPYSCTIHSWMKGYVATFKHPYFAVTDENGNFELKNVPAGKYRVVLWHEKAGWVVNKDPEKPATRGLTGTLTSGGTADLKQIKMTLPKD